jgi:DNA polymerase-1
LRIIAEASQDPLWLRIYGEGGDLHSVICSKFFKIPIEDVAKPFPLKPDMKYRDVIKIINFGLVYGMTEYSLAVKTGCSVEEARKLIGDYFKVVPKVKQLLDNYGTLVRENFVAYTLPPICRPRFFDKRKLHYPDANRAAIMGEIERAGKNSPVQGTNADWIKIALVLIYEYIQKHKYPAKLRLVIHDEIITSTLNEKAEEWSKIQAALMEQAGSYIIKSIPVKAETKILDYWTK